MEPFRLQKLSAIQRQARIQSRIVAWRSALRERNAFTLIELILVISIIVVVAALAMPAVQRTIDSQSITKAADRVRVSMGKARVRAIRTGEVHALFYSPGQSWFDVAPISQYQQQATRAAQRIQAVQQNVTMDLENDLLPRGVRFAAGETANDSRSAEAVQSAQAEGELEMILFYPDGTSQDAKLTLQNQVGDLIAVELRGLTGLSKSIRIVEFNSRRR